MIHTIDAVTAGGGTNLEECFRSFGEHLKRRGLVAVISDLYCDPAAMSKAVQPLAYHGHDIMIFQLLDPRELQPDWRESVLLEDVETQQDDQRRRRSISRASIARSSARIWLRCARRPPTSARTSC